MGRLNTVLYLKTVRPFFVEWLWVLVVLLMFLLPVNLATSGYIAVDSWNIVHSIGWRIFWGFAAAFVFLSLLLSPFFWARSIWGSQVPAGWQKWLLFLWVIEMFAVLPLFGHNTTIAVYNFLGGF